MTCGHYNGWWRINTGERDTDTGCSFVGMLAENHSRQIGRIAVKDREICLPTFGDRCHIIIAAITT